MIGQTLDGRYVVRSRIARGGMAMVYLATDLRLERRVAVKVMHPHLAEEENFTRRFEQEARSAAGLSHANLVGVFDQGRDAGRTYLVMEYLPSITLRDLLKQQKRLSADQAVEISEAVLAGLAAAHGAGIVHRDLKPENVLLADDGRIKLGDFGLARAVSANTTTGQALLGTIAYLSPELVTRGVADARSDLYAFGIMLYEMLTGEQPFTGEQPMQIAYQHAHSDVPAPSLKSPESTTELDELVRWTTQRDPELRPRDAREAHAHLAALRQGLTPPGATRVLDDFDGALATPSTTVLAPAQQDLLAESTGADPSDAGDEAGRAEAPPTEHAAEAARGRARRGGILAGITVVLIAAIGGLGWWLGQGPGSLATVPDVAGSDLSVAINEIESASLVPEVFECSSLEIPAGLAARTEPRADERIERGSLVRLCQSTGPELLAVPTIVGLSLEDARRTIEEAGFRVGDVSEQRFAVEEADTVLAALGTDGEALGETYPEQGPIDLVLSAGPLPDVSGATEEEATARLTSAGLHVEPSLRSEAHNAEIPEGHAIGFAVTTDPVRPGDSVGLQVSLGPELFEIPSVSGLPLQEAMDALAQAGFSPTTLVPEALRGFAQASHTTPEAGELVPHGTEIQVRATLSL